jgi:hypothetical protein
MTIFSQTDSSHSRPPAPDELEISLFGPGVGESVVVHLGDGRWMVVDSCLNPISREPIALEYLRFLSVDPRSALCGMVVTHWHDDHTAGTTRILEGAPEAKLVCSTAFGADELRRALEVSNALRNARTGVDELRKVFDHLHRTKRKPVLAVANRPIISTARALVTALSPADTTLWRAFGSLAPLLLAKKGQCLRRVPRHMENDASVALRIEFGSFCVVLGGDLEAGTGADRGWRAIVGDPLRSRLLGGVYKVAHHGSDDADIDEIWTDLLAPNPIAILTPYARGRVPRPSDEDRRRVLGRTPNAHLTSPSRPHRAKTVARAGERLLRKRGIRVQEIEKRMGHIRVRATPGNAPVVEHFGAAAMIR